MSNLFQPAPPVGAETCTTSPLFTLQSGISTRSARGGGDLRAHGPLEHAISISTRSARGGGDAAGDNAPLRNFLNFNPLRPRGRRRPFRRTV